MKGIAEITVRDKDGKIKLQRRAKNTITTAYLEKMKQALKCQIFAKTLPTTGAADFQGIWLHSEQLDNLVDMKPVVLCGSTNARASGAGQDYSSATKSEINGNNITSTWVWVLEKDVTIKAISLHRSSFVGAGTGGALENHAIFCGSKAFTCSEYDYGDYRFDGQSKINGLQMATFSKDLVCEKQNESTRVAAPLYASNEYLYSSTVANYYTSYVKIRGECKIVDDTFAEVRTFTVSQFAGLSNEATYDCAVMPTAAADWLFVFKSTTEVAVYKIPRSASADTIPLVTTITGASLQATTTMVVSNCVIFNMNAHSKKMFTALADGTYLLEDGVQIINTAFAYEVGRINYYLLNRADNPMPVTDFRIGGENFGYSGGSRSGPGVGATTPLLLHFSNFPHNTILNLSSPIEVVTGDTLSISYTVTVSEGAE